MTNSLITSAWVKVELERWLHSYRMDVKERETLLAEFIAETGARPEDIILEMRGPVLKPTYIVRVKTIDERWLDWLSSNHGWEERYAHCED